MGDSGQQCSMVVRDTGVKMVCGGRAVSFVSCLAALALLIEMSITPFERRWVNDSYQEKRTLLSVMLEGVRLNFANLEFSLRKPFDLLRIEKLVPLSGVTGIRTPNPTMPWSCDPISL